MRISLVVLVLSLSGCGLHLTHSEKAEKPAGGYQTVRHTVTYETHPQCVGSCVIQ